MTSASQVIAVVCSLIVATLTRDGVDLRYEVTGSGPAILLPALNFRWADYLDIGLLAGCFTVVTASPRGFGASGRLPGAGDRSIRRFKPGQRRPKPTRPPGRT